jgi:prepilin-type N-terminal cleavage/methylation domain-containing protein
MPNHAHSARGFTLIEMLVSIAIGLIMIAVGIAGYLDFNQRQKILNSAKEFEVILQTAQTKARLGDLGGCDVLAAYIVTFDTAVDPIVATVSPVCTVGSATDTKTFSLETGTTMDLAPVVTSLSYPVLQGGVVFAPATNSLTVTFGSQTTSEEYVVTMTRGGDISDGAWQ